MGTSDEEDILCCLNISALYTCYSGVSVLVLFTFNLTINNLEFEEDMHCLGSWKFNTTERIL
jgi:hypothetical protein